MEQTIKNLAKAFIGESQARNRYNFYASVARKEGYEQIAEIFALTADQEKEHAKRLFEHLQELKVKGGVEGEVSVEAGMPTVLGTTAENLKAAIAGENHEHTSMYPEFATIAEQEGLPHIAARMLSIAKAESHHEWRYQKLLDQVEAGSVFKKDQDTWWVCMECGYVHFGKEAPVKCPSCDHAQAFYQVKSEQY